MENKPLIIYVTGAPGSGKTTLAEQISKQLFIPHVSSDLIHGGVRFTIDRPNDRLETLHNVFVSTMVDMAKHGLSFVVDHVLQKDISKPDIIDKISPYANIIYIHTKSNDAINRHLSRELARDDRGIVLDENDRKKRAEFHALNLSQTENPADFETPVLVVDTTNGYTPTINEILDFIMAESKK